MFESCAALIIHVNYRKLPRKGLLGKGLMRRLHKLQKLNEIKTLKLKGLGSGLFTVPPTAKICNSIVLKATNTLPNKQTK